MKINTRHIALAAALLLIADRGLAGTGAVSAAAATVPPAVIASPAPTASGGSYFDSSDGGHAITADGETACYTNITVDKTGNAGDASADLNGGNAAILAVNGANLDLREASVTSDGIHTDAVFSHGEGTTVNIADSTVKTLGSSSGALVTAEGGALNAKNLVVRTAGDFSPAIRGNGGALRVSGGTYDATGVGSPTIYAASEITVRDAELSAAAAQGAVVDGGGTVTLENVALTANHVKRTENNNGEFPRYQAVLLCETDEGAQNAATFTMTGGSLTNLHGDIFEISSARTTINLTGAAIINDDPEGVFLRATGGSKAELYTASQKMEGDMLADGNSRLEIHLWDGSVYTGAINPTDEGAVSVELTDGAVWTLTGDSHIESLRCEADSIRLNGHVLTVGGKVYVEGDG